MSAINGKNLKILRDQKGWSLDDLAAKARIDRGTISRIETGKQLGRRRHTIESLAAALEVDATVLTGSDYQPPASPADSALYSSLNIRLGNDARNALALVARRYEVNPAHIVTLAPLLFLWAAEESLRLRKQNLDARDEQAGALEKAFEFGHLNGLITNNWRGDEVADEERRSIGNRDIFGYRIDDEALPFEYDEGDSNPMALFLRGLTTSLGGLAEFERWAPQWHEPSYTLGQDEALELANGDEQAAHYIVAGYAPLHEMPKAVRDGGPPAIAEWALSRGKEFLDKLVANIDFEL